MATVKDIAKEAGVSIGTVDRVIHKRGRFSVETGLKVKRAMDKLGYQTNVMARNLSKSATCSIAVLMPFPEMDSAYWSLCLSGIQRASRRLKAYKVETQIFYYNRYSRESFQEAFLLMVQEPWDGYLMAPLFETDFLGMQSLLKKDSPFVFFDTDIEDSGRLSFIGQDSYKGGRLAGKLMRLLEADPIKEIIILQPDAENNHIHQRICGFQDNCPAKTRIIRAGIEAGEDKSTFFEQLDQIVNDQTGGIFVVDASAHYTADYLKHNQANPKIPLIGFDLVPENREAVAGGMIDFLLTQRPEDQGYLGVESLYRSILLGEEQRDRFMPLDILTKENLPEI